MCVRKRKPGIRPAVSLGFELVLSVGGLALSALLILFTADSGRWKQWFDGDGTDASGRLHTPFPNYVANGQFWLAMSIAATVFAFFVS